MICRIKCMDTAYHQYEWQHVDGDTDTLSMTCGTQCIDKVSVLCGLPYVA